MAALVLVFGFRRTTAAYCVIGLLGLFATLESAFAFCVGCRLFALLMRLGLVPEVVCAECADIWERPRARAPVAAPEEPPAR